MNCLHSRVQRFVIKDPNWEKVKFYIYCCIDCKKITENYGSKDKEWEKTVINDIDIEMTLNPDLENDIELYKEWLYDLVRKQAELTRKSLDGELKDENN